MSRPYRAPSAQIIACPDCDLLQRPVTPAERGATVCARCRAILLRHHPDSIDRALALALGAAIMLALANAFPIVTLSVQGQPVSATLLDTVRTLWLDDMQALAVLVAFTVLVAPALEIFSAAYVLLHLRLRARPRFAAAALRIAYGIDEWSMIEVLMLGALVALVKLNDYARVEFGISLWCLGVLMVLLAALGASFDARAAWERLEPAA